jgi:hypothetical protein
MRCAIAPYALLRFAAYISDMTTAEDIEKAVEQLAPRDLAWFREVRGVRRGAIRQRH